MSGFRLSTTLFALTERVALAPVYTFEELVGRTVQLGPRPGLELIGFQSIRGFPRSTPSSSGRSRGFSNQHGLDPSVSARTSTSPGAPMDIMSRDEVMESVAAQVEAAQVLGFPVVRAQKLDDDLYEWAATLAEKAGVKLGIEIHAPLFVDHPMIAGLREIFDRIDSPSLGFIPDWSATMTALPGRQLRAFERNGLTRAQTEHCASCGAGRSAERSLRRVRRARPRRRRVRSGDQPGPHHLLDVRAERSETLARDHASRHPRPREVPTSSRRTERTHRAASRAVRRSRVTATTRGSCRASGGARVGGHGGRRRLRNGFVVTSSCIASCSRRTCRLRQGDGPRSCNAAG